MKCSGGPNVVRDGVPDICNQLTKRMQTISGGLGLGKGQNLIISYYYILR